MFPVKLQRPFPERPAVVVQIAPAPPPADAAIQNPESGNVPFGVLLSNPKSSSFSDARTSLTGKKRTKLGRISSRRRHNRGIRVCSTWVRALQHETTNRLPKKEKCAGDAARIPHKT